MAEEKKETVHLSKHRVVMHLNQGGLHRALGISEDKDIPKSDIARATHSTNPHEKAMAVLAQNMSHWNHGG